MPFVNDFEAGLFLARRTQRPLLVDFSGVNSISCAEMRLRMAQPDWIHRLDNFVCVRLFVDNIPHIVDRDEGQRIAKLNRELQLRLLEHTATLPSYAIIDPNDRSVLTTYIGAEFIPQTGSFIKFLDKGWQRWEGQLAKSARNER